MNDLFYKHYDKKLIFIKRKAYEFFDLHYFTLKIYQAFFS
jgi:hypothetical protein